jgi:energy-coupling factor transport system substrate-specific component
MNAAFAARLRALPLSSTILIAINLLGAAAFLYPFLLSRPAAGDLNSAHAQAAPLIFALLGPALLALLIAELSSGRLTTRTVAVLGVLTGVVAVLRLPAGPGDSPAFFFLILLAGYVYGARFGFLLGALALLVSALITGGIGPWLPFQMFVTGWLGLSSGLIAPLLQRLVPPASRRELLLLAAFGYLWGFLFGALMNLWFWPFAGPGALNWQPGLGLLATLQRYAAFYTLTSLAWDALRAVSNLLLILLLGRPVLRELRRFQARFHFTAAAPPDA